MLALGLGVAWSEGSSGSRGQGLLTSDFPVGPLEQEGQGFCVGCAALKSCLIYMVFVCFCKARMLSQGLGYPPTVNELSMCLGGEMPQMIVSLSI